jgi:uncharacterized protein
MNGMSPAPTLVLYHADCPDGFGAAWSYWKKLGASAQYVPYAYDSPNQMLPNLAGHDVVMVDVSDTPERLAMIRARAQSFRLLDHHTTAEAELGSQPYAEFDASHSGAMLAWQDAFGAVPAPRLIRMIETRDLARADDPEAAQALLVLDSLPRDFAAWDAFNDRLAQDFQGVLREGQAMAQQHHRLVDRMVDHATSVTLAGVPGYLVNADPVFANDVAERLQDIRPLVMTWYVDKDGVGHLSFRANAERFNVAPLAVAMNGGGSAGSGATRVSFTQIQALYAGQDLLAHERSLVAQMQVLKAHFDASAPELNFPSLAPSPPAPCRHRHP